MATDGHLADVSEVVKGGSDVDPSSSPTSNRKESGKQRKVNHLHKLERKHSSGDLHSRLKTRKLLGVGETDDGDVHRSKLSQILGHSEQLYVKLPKGLRIWQLTNALMFSVIGAWALVFPLNLFSFAVTSQTDAIVILPIRLYGAALLTLSVMFWSTLWSVDKDTIRWSLRASVLYFTVQFIVTTLTLLEQGTLLSLGPRILSHRMFFAFISAYFVWAIDHKFPKMRKTNSSKDLTKE